MSETNSQSANNVSEFNRFLNNNTGFIYQKYEKYFEDPFPMRELTSQQNIQNSLKFIYDIFSFHKYENNPKLNEVLRKGLTDNIRQFAELTLKNGNKSIQFTKDQSVNLLKYCIQNNDMFAVQYDKKNKKKNETQQEPKPQAIQQKKEEPRQQYKELHEVVQPSSETKEPAPPSTPTPGIMPKNQLKSEPKTQPKSEPKSQQEQKTNPRSSNHFEAETAQEATSQTPKTKRIQPYSIKEKVSDEMKCINEFEESMPNLPKHQNIDLIRKQLKNVFDFYCKQQQNVTPNSTFDIINHKCQTMNLGKFLFFAVASNIVQSKEKAYSQARLDKKTAISMFKRFAEGQRQIDFKVFMTIMDQIHKNDEKIYIRMGLGDEGGKGKSKIVQNLKYFNLPFYTRDQAGRQTSPHGRIFVPKLTTHSGKIQEALKEQLIVRKERPYFEPNDKSRAESKTIFRNKVQSKDPGYTFEETSKFTLKLGQTNEQGEPENLKFLSKLITHEENDEVFLKDYYLPLNKKSILSNKESTFEENGRYTKQQSISMLDKQFGKNPGQFTSRPGKEQLVLPLIKQKNNQGMLTQRRSLGIEKRHGYKL